MSWVITAVVVAGAVTAHGQRTAGKIQEQEFERQAEEEKLAAQGEELQRRQQLNKVLAANVASMAESGMAGEGTPASISLESAKQASVSEGVISLSEKLKQAQLRRQGKNAAATGRIRATSTLLSTGAQAMSLKK